LARKEENPPTSFLHLGVVGGGCKSKGDNNQGSWFLENVKGIGQGKDPL